MIHFHFDGGGGKRAMDHPAKFSLLSNEWLSSAVIATIAIVLMLALSGCAADKEWFPPGGGLYGITLDAQQAADDKKCSELGFKPPSDAYGNCRLQLEQIRATERAAAAKPSEGARRATTLTQQSNNSPVLGSQKKVYSRDECIGPVIMGRCEGSILPKKAYHPTCHGEWLNGRCTGPMF